jgi:hypothetical protein
MQLLASRRAPSAPEPVYPAVAAYAASGFRDVQGWCAPETLNIVAALAGLQDKEGVAGGSAEIGVYHGKLLIALHLVRSAGTRTLAVDLFENQDRNLDRSGAGSSSELRDNLRAHAVEPEFVDTLARDSLDLTDGDVARIETEYGRFRWFSVDGGHTVGHAINDIQIAERLTASGGIVVVDDYTNSDWPGVNEGVARHFILGNPRFVPLICGFNKLYLTTLSHHGRYYDAMRDALKASFRVKPVDMYGHRALSLRTPRSSR